MVITTLGSIFCVAALQHRTNQCRMLPCMTLKGGGGSINPKMLYEQWVWWVAEAPEILL